MQITPKPPAPIIRYSEQDFPDLEAVQNDGTVKKIDLAAENYDPQKYVPGELLTALNQIRTNQYQLEPEKPIHVPQEIESLLPLAEKYVAAFAPETTTSLIRALYARTKLGAGLGAYDMQTTAILAQNAQNQEEFQKILEFRKNLLRLLFGEHEYGEFLEVMNGTGSDAKKELARQKLLEQIDIETSIILGIRIALKKIFNNKLIGKELELNQQNWREQIDILFQEYALHVRDYADSDFAQKKLEDLGEFENESLRHGMAHASTRLQMYLHSIGKEPNEEEARCMQKILQSLKLDSVNDQMQLILEDIIYFELNQIQMCLRGKREFADFATLLKIYDEFIGQQYDIPDDEKHTARTILATFADLKLPEDLYDKKSNKVKKLIESTREVEETIAYLFLKEFSGKVQAKPFSLHELFTKILNTALNNQGLSENIKQEYEEDYVSRCYFSIYESYYNGICKAVLEDYDFPEEEIEGFLGLRQRYLDDIAFFQEKFTTLDKDFKDQDLELLSLIAMALVKNDTSSLDERRLDALNMKKITKQTKGFLQHAREKLIGAESDPTIPEATRSQADKLQQKHKKQLKGMQQLTDVRKMFTLEIHSELDKVFAFYREYPENWDYPLTLEWTDPEDTQKNEKIVLFSESPENYNIKEFGNTIKASIQKLCRANNIKTIQSVAIAVPDAMTQDKTAKERQKIGKSEQCHLIARFFPNNLQRHIPDLLASFWLHGEQGVKYLKITFSPNNKTEGAFEIFYSIRQDVDFQTMNTDQYLDAMKTAIQKLIKQESNAKPIAISPATIEEQNQIDDDEESSEQQKIEFYLN